MKQHLKATSVVGFLSFPLFVLLSGCGLATTDSAAPAIPGVKISGGVHGGQQPIAGARVYLLAVNHTAYAGPGIAASSSNASISLLNQSSTGNTTDTIGSYVVSDANGAFTITADYSCGSGFVQGTTTPAQPYSSNQSAGTEQVYLYAVGGTSTNASSPNLASGLLAALGPCNGLSTSSFFIVNELTTVATAYAFGGFATDATHIGFSGSTLAVTNLNNAFANVAQLVNTATGSTTPNSGNVVRPVAFLTAIADILGACINTTGPTGSSTNCSTLFAHTNSAGDTGTAATDTATAAVNLAHNPWPSAAGVSALYGLIPASPAFAGAVTAQPNEFSLFLQFSGNNLFQPQGLAIDASGNVWVNSRAPSAAQPVISYAAKFSNAGTPLFSVANLTSSNLVNPDSIAIDTSGNAWVAAQNTFATIGEFSSTGTPDSGGGSYTGGAINSSFGVAIDASGNAWFANQGDGYVSEFNNSGNPISAGVKSPASDRPTGVAIDASGSVWVTNYGGTTVSKFNSSGGYIADYTGGGLFSGAGGVGIAIDGSGNAWTTNFQASTVSEFTSTGTPLSGSSGYSGGGLNDPQQIAIDSAGRAWLCNVGYTSLTLLSSNGTALSSSIGYTGYAPSSSTPIVMNQPYFLAIDGAGNVWASNYGNATLTEMIGAAAPVVTPLAANLVSPYGTAAVNRP